MLSCNRDDQRLTFENKLNSFIGKSTDDVIDEFGNKPKYENKTRVDGVQCTFMVYDYDYNIVGTIYKCQVRFCVKQGTGKVLDYDYRGDGCF